MGDRTQRVKGKAEETKGRLKRETGAATGRPGTEARGAGEELKGKAQAREVRAFLDGGSMRTLIEGAAYLFCNEYEAAVIESKTGWAAEDIFSHS